MVFALSAGYLSRLLAPLPWLVTQPGVSIRAGGPTSFRILAVFRRLLALLGEVPAKGPRRDSDEATELLGEVAGTREAHLLSHHPHGKIGIREQRLGPLDPLPNDVLVRGEPCRKLEHPREVVGAHMDLAGDLCQPGP